ncbi:MAG: hypothetical protein GF411_10055 [Candidatus Lokiarchaeota archaeon]|nr:hypothetical protein [Candidatus Lokiarchaeota archaeon]
MSEDITELEMEILRVILNDSHRPAAITRILKKNHVECDQNAVVQALQSLEARDLVERYTTKTWIGKSSAEKYFS